MTEYIRREDVLEFSRIFTDQVWETGGYRNCTTIAVPVEKIEEIPSADVVEVKRGEWEMKPDPYGFFEEIPVCSECGCTTEMRKTYNYCPECGARMDGGT